MHTTFTFRRIHGVSSLTQATARLFFLLMLHELFTTIYLCRPNDDILLLNLIQYTIRKTYAKYANFDLPPNFITILQSNCEAMIMLMEAMRPSKFRPLSSIIYMRRSGSCTFVSQRPVVKCMATDELSIT